MKNIALILDTSLDQYGNTSWLPNYNHIYSIDNWNIGTIWGSPAGKNNHIVGLDLRIPLRKRIIVNNIEHPKFVYFSKQR